MITVLLIKSGLGASLDYSDGWGVGFGLVMLDMVVSETRRVTSMVSGRLCGNLSWVSTFGRVVVC
jgi:hypothetical protein